LRELGVLVTQNPTDCTHLAAPAMVRTQKFLCALANGPTIVSSEFIDTCIKTGEIPNVDDFLLKDKENEKKFGLKLKDTIVRAKANKKNLLRRVPIYCTKDIPNGSDTYKAIVEVNGGTFAVYTGRPTIKKTKPEEDEGPAEPVYLITGLKPAERQLWPKFTEMAEQGNMIPRIVTTEWLLDVAMSQQHKWDNKYLAENDR
jgi:Regulator of Ty1 transposition protein 107 BRCT domain